MKGYLPIILLLIASLMLPSCVGVGDGALTGGNTTDAEPTEGLDETRPSEPDGACVINIYNSEGHSTQIARPNEEQQAILREQLDADDYTEDYNVTDMTSYIHVLFRDSHGNKEAYQIYSNDSVAYISDNPSLTVERGTKEGIYRKVRDIMTESNEYIARAERAAGYSFTSIMVCADSATSFKLIDFSELDCIGIIHLMDDKKSGQTWYTFYFDCDTKERIDEIAKELDSRKDVVGINLNYIMSID